MDFTALDYRAHGQSGGEFRDYTIGGLEDTLEIFDAITRGPQIVVGSSMGGSWIALLLCRERKERIAGMIGITAAPDFTERLIWEKLDERMRARMEEGGNYAALHNTTSAK